MSDEEDDIQYIKYTQIKKGDVLVENKLFRLTTNTPNELNLFYLKNGEFLMCWMIYDLSSKHRKVALNALLSKLGFKIKWNY